jgi:hypothetical protein
LLLMHQLTDQSRSKALIDAEPCTRAAAGARMNRKPAAYLGTCIVLLTAMLTLRHSGYWWNLQL